MRDWLLVPPVSGIECVRALCRAGFVIEARPAGCIALRHGCETIEVPLAAVLEREVLAAILYRACVAPAAFVELLGD